MRLNLASKTNIINGQNIWFLSMAAILAALLIWQLLRLLFLILSPVVPVGGWQPRQAVIAPVEERTAILSRYNPFTGETFAGASQNKGPATVTSLDLVLYGTRTNSLADKGSAIIAGSDGVQKNYLIGDEIMPGVTLAAVAFDNITLERRGKRESLFLDQSDEVQSFDTGDEKALNEEQAPDGSDDFEVNVDSLSSGLSFTPRRDGSKVTGLAFTAQSNALALDWLGFEKDDVIVQYDNIDISSADDADAFLKKMQPSARFSVLVERGASLVPVAIILPED